MASHARLVKSHEKKANLPVIHDDEALTYVSVHEKGSPRTKYVPVLPGPETSAPVPLLVLAAPHGRPVPSSREPGPCCTAVDLWYGGGPRVRGLSPHVTDGTGREWDRVMGARVFLRFGGWREPPRSHGPSSSSSRQYCSRGAGPDKITRMQLNYHGDGRTDGLRLVLSCTAHMLVVRRHRRVC